MNVKFQSPYISGDALRKQLELMKKLFNQYTRKNFGYEDINGSKYNGTVENFGNEILIESRKLLMNRPSINTINIGTDLSYYFKIQYSSLINAYNQQYLLTALLNKDILDTNNRYYIRFDNCNEEYILRSEGSSQSPVKKDMFYHTTTNPVLCIDDGNEITEVDLILNDGENDTHYYFYNNPVTESFISDYSNNTLTTIDITNDLYDLPFIWMCVDKFRLLPELTFVNDLDILNRPLLTHGTDAKSIFRLYPYFDSNNIPDDTVTKKWFIQVTSKDGEFTIPSTRENYIVQVDTITYLNTSGIVGHPYQYKQTITYDDTNVKIFLSDECDWKFYEANGIVYAYIELNDFIDNINLDSEMKSAFRIKFSDIINDLTPLMDNAVSGIHVDISSEYNENGVIEKNGVTHGMGDLDGLPPHLKYQLDRKLSRAHVDIYSIRDIINKYNTDINDKQISGLIIDSGIPDNERDQEIIKQLGVNIKYNFQLNRYETSGEIKDPNNVVSEMVPDGNTISNTLISSSTETPFMFHLNETFSNRLIDNSTLQDSGRIYVVSNDNNVYENNSLTENPKPGSTIARICDIPTSFIQLTNIIDLSPSLLVDWNSSVEVSYVRTECSFTVKDKNDIWNDKCNNIFHHSYVYIFGSGSDLNDDLHWSFDKYKKLTNFNQSIDLSTMDETLFQFTVSNPLDTSGYEVNDTFKFNIGGVYFDGVVDAVEEDGSVVSISVIESSNPRLINISNIGYETTTYVCTSTIGDGNGLRVSLHIENFESYLPYYSNEYIDNLHAYRYDEYDNIWLWEFDHERNQFYQSTQITGEVVVYNYYDTYVSQTSRKPTDVFLYNNLQLNSVMTDVMIGHNDISFEFDGDPDDHDRSNELSNYNYQNGLYYFKRDEESNGILSIYQNYNCELYRQQLIPRFHQLNLTSYRNMVCSLLLTSDDVIMYDPNNDDMSTVTINDKKSNVKPSYLYTYFSDIINIENGIGKLTHNLYQYNDTSETNSRKEYRESLYELSRESLITKINDINNNAIPLSYESTNYAYTKQMLIDYLMENYYDNPTYKRDEISLLRNKGEQVITKRGSLITNVGKQPTFGFVSMNHPINTNIRLNGSSVEYDMIDVCYVFKMDTKDDIVSLSNFRMYDKYHNDISNKTLLIYGNEKYLFINNEWISI